MTATKTLPKTAQKAVKALPKGKWIASEDLVRKITGISDGYLFSWERDNTLRQVRHLKDRYGVQLETRNKDGKYQYRRVSSI